MGAERRAIDGLRTAGPFSVLGRHFVVRSSVGAVVDAFVDGCGDLRSEGEPTEATVYRVDRTGPRWHQFGFSLWRDEQLVYREVLGTLLPTLIPSDFARHVASEAAGLIAVKGVAVARHDGVVVLVADTVDPSRVPNEGWLDLHALAVQAMRRGWALTALDVVPLDASVSGLQALPFPRPFAARRETQLATLIGSAGLHRLVPASSVGPLSGRTAVRALAVVRDISSDPATIEPASPSTVLRALASQLSGTGHTRREAFLRMAEWVEVIPGRVLYLSDDLDASVARLEDDL